MKMHREKRTHSLSGLALGVISRRKPKQPHWAEWSVCLKWPLECLDRHHSLSAHLAALQTEHGHKEWIQLDLKRKEVEAEGEREREKERERE